MALVFDVQQANGKPDDNRRPGTACPFCDTEELADIIRRDGDCIWLENKFKTLRATRQTVLIESADHDADLVIYEPDGTKKHGRNSRDNGSFRSYSRALPEQST